jgi:RNA polymerase sigma factor (TIGR02999 family)
MEPEDELSAWLEADREGRDPAPERIFQLVYDELRDLASIQRRRWHGHYTLNTTALAHEAYLKLAGGRGSWQDRAHFMAVAARAMRQILVNYAEQRRARKRGGGVPDIPLEDANPISEESSEEVLALHEALDRLSRVSPRQARVVEVRFFVGLSIEETSAVLGISQATVKRDWSLAGAWLQREIRNILESG